MSEVLIREPRVTIDCPLGPVSCDEITISAAVNTHVSAAFTAYSGSEAAKSATKVMAAQVAAKMGQAQRIGFSNRTSPDTRIRAEDGAGGIGTYNLFLTGPTFMMNTGSIRPGFAAVAESALVANLKMDIYTTNTGRNKGNKDSLSGGALIPEKVCKSTNLAGRIKELTEAVIKNWQRYGAGTSAEAQLKQQRHQINLNGPLNLWYQMLDNSVPRLESTAEWMEILTKDGGDATNRDFNMEILSVLRGTTRDFQETIDTIRGMFQLVVIPDRSGGPGSFAVMPELLLAEPLPLVLPATSMLLNGDSSQDLLPLQQVLVRGQPIFATLISRDPSLSSTDGGEYYIGGFPDEVPSASGDVAIVALPSFLRDTLTRVTSMRGNRPPAPETISAGFSQISQLTSQFTSEIARKLIRDYCRGVYVDMALGGTSTSISVPADLSLWPGNRYRVLNSDGDEIFTGFLAGVQHMFKKSPGSGGQAISTCNFTHILFPGFQLPGI